MGECYRFYAAAMTEFMEQLAKLRDEIQLQPDERVVRARFGNAEKLPLATLYGQLMYTGSSSTDAPVGVNHGEWAKYEEFHFRLAKQLAVLRLLASYLYVAGSDVYFLEMNPADGVLHAALTRMTGLQARQQFGYLDVPGFTISSIVVAAEQTNYHTAKPDVRSLGFVDLVTGNDYFPKMVAAVEWVPAPAYVPGIVLPRQLNTYVPSGLTPMDLENNVDGVSNDVAIFVLNYIRYFFCDDEKQFQQFIEWMALVVHVGWKRSQRIPAIVGAMGEGKTHLANLLSAILGPTLSEVTSVQDAVTGTFADVRRRLIVLDDVPESRNQPGKTWVRALSTQKRAHLNQKFLPAISVMNCLELMLIQNDVERVPDLEEVNQRRVWLLIMSSSQIFHHFSAEGLRDQFMSAMDSIVTSGTAAFALARYLRAVYLKLGETRLHDRVIRFEQTPHGLKEQAVRQYKADPVVRFVVDGLGRGFLVGIVKTRRVLTRRVGDLPNGQTEISAYRDEQYRDESWHEQVPLKSMHDAYKQHHNITPMSLEEFRSRFCAVLGAKCEKETLLIPGFALCCEKMKGHLQSKETEQLLNERPVNLQRALSSSEQSFIEQFVCNRLFEDVWGINEQFFDGEGMVYGDLALYEAASRPPPPKRAKSAKDILAAITANRS